MGRHVNYEDEQDRWLNKADKLTRNFKKLSLEEKDPRSLSLAEQLELERRRKKTNGLKKEQIDEVKKEEIRISHYRPKQD